MHIAVGNVSKDEWFQKSLKLYNRVNKKKKHKAVQTTGYSLGGALSFFVGRKKGAHGVSHNPKKD
jgi:putative lipase involved disintegration of autophagic bodies